MLNSAEIFFIVGFIVTIFVSIGIVSKDESSSKSQVYLDVITDG